MNESQRRNGGAVGYAGALRDTGNTRFPLLATGGALWLSVGLAYALLASVGGLIAVWAGFLALAPAQALIYRWRWRLTMRDYCRSSVSMVLANLP